jgi:hypothetical protein
VYLARLIAIELIAPRLCAPGVIECAAEEMGLDAASLADLRHPQGLRPTTENAGQWQASVLQMAASLTCF